MESILKLQEAAAERQQKVAVQLESVARQEKEPAPQAEQEPKAVDAVKPIESSVSKPSLAEVKRGIKRARDAANATKLSTAGGVETAPPVKKTARKAAFNPFKKTTVASPQRPRRAQDVLSKLAMSPSPKPALGRQSSAAQAIINKGKDKKLF